MRELNKIDGEENKLSNLFPATTQESEAEHREFSLSDDIVREIIQYLHEGKVKKIQDICISLEAPDIAELISKIDGDGRYQLVNILDDGVDAEVFTLLDDDLRDEILQRMEISKVANIINQLDSDDALFLIESFDEDKQKEILRTLSRTMRVVIEEGLTFPEDSAGRLMQREFVSIPKFWSVGKTLDYLRAASNSLPNDFYDIFIVDPLHHVIGKVPLSNILRARRNIKIEELIEDSNPHPVSVNADQEEVAFLFRKYGLVSAPVIDEDNRLVGVITVDDIVDVIDEEAGEDFLKLGGVTSNTDIYRATIDTTKARFGWLAINLLTAILASMVIGLFEGTIKEVVALAVLMPIVASMGGNAGTQTLTVTVRSLATRELSSANAIRIVLKEIAVGTLNGLLFAIIMGAVVWLWFNDLTLGVVIGVAMIVNLIVAGFAGVIIPLSFSKMGYDPALSSTVFLTTVTDVIGFFAFLGLASWALL